MSVTVRVPAQLRTLTGGAAQLSVEGSTVGEVLKALDATHPGFDDRLFDETGSSDASSTSSSPTRTSDSSTVSTRP